MRKLGMIAMLLIVLSINGTASASPCDTAQRGTYLSNVCWLVHDFTVGGRISRPIVAVNEEKCSVDIFGNHQIFFKQSDGNFRVYEQGGEMCWELYGRDIATFPKPFSASVTIIGEAVLFDAVTVCGRPIEKSRIERAITNLFNKFCSIEKPEF